MMRYRLLLIVLGVFLLPALQHTFPSNAQPVDSCPAIVETALQAVDAVCADTGRNQACYANVALEALPQPTVADFRFEAVGDIVDVNDLAELRLSPMNSEEGYWGVALMRLQTSLPDTLPGQNVTFILFGDVQLTNATPPETVTEGQSTPMQAFYLTTGVGSVGCQEAPENGLLVQTPEGVGEVTFTINDIVVEMGSTVLFQAHPEGELVVSTLEGSAVLTIGEEVYPVVAGTRIRAEIDETLQVVGEVSQPEPYEPELAERVPLPALRREIEPQPPFNPEQIERLNTLLEEGRPPCGEAPLPACERLPVSAGGVACVLPRLEIRPDDQRPQCDISRVPPEEPRRSSEDQGILPTQPGTRGDSNPPGRANETPDGTGQGRPMPRLTLTIQPPLPEVPPRATEGQPPRNPPTLVPSVPTEQPPRQPLPTLEPPRQPLPPTEEPPRQPLPTLEPPRQPPPTEELPPPMPTR
ncbi:MAG: hypothetical protein SF029_05820 [bacterium]|nr:hypothetical protein [bacterium]